MLNLFAEPVFILSCSGTVLQANNAARRLTGIDPTGLHFPDLIATPRIEFEAWLQRCSGTAQPLPGAIAFAEIGGSGRRMRAYGARLNGIEDPVRIGVRCMPHHADEFSVLAGKVRELNAEIRERRRTQAVLEESLAQNELLLRELHHRVKNNIQMLVGLFATARRETHSEEVRGFLSDANRRLMAIGAAQQLMYRSHSLEVVSAAAFLTSLCEAIGATLGSEVCLDVTADEVSLSNETAFPLALIVNELVTNAFKHGLDGEAGHIKVSLHADGGMFTLLVTDDGPGFPPNADSGRRSSGLGLVRGLSRQIGGALTITTSGGGQCTVRFSHHATSA